MVTITLTNKNPNTAINKVSIDIAKRLCTLPDQQKIKLVRLQNEFDFQHPLLTEKVALAPSYFFHYEYNTLEAMLRSAIYVYSTLLQVDKPQACRFKISPSKSFKRTKHPKGVHFSIHPNKQAKEFITIKQLESLVQGFKKSPFNFSNDILIDDEFSFAQLPKSINADLLYESNANMLQLLLAPLKSEHFELRYISIDIGFGVYCRTNLPENEIIGVYSGIKTHHTPGSQYKFGCREDVLKMYLDANQFGNLTRFMNHAPSEDDEEYAESTTLNSNRTKLLSANVSAEHVNLNGIAVVIYRTKRAILKNEPLLLDYGNDFFHGDKPNLVRFNSKGKLVDSYNRFARYYQRKKVGVAPLRVMAEQGIKAAQHYVLLRMLIILSLFAVIGGILNS